MSPGPAVARLHPRDIAGQIAAMPRVLQVLFPVALGAVIALAHEAWMPGFWPVAIGLTVAFLTLPQGRRQAAVFGWLLGVGYFGLTLRWIIEPFFVDVARHGWMAPFAILFMAGGLALFWALAAWGARVFGGQAPNGILWFAVLLTAAELSRGHVLSGFPWGMVSYATVGSIWDVWLAWVGPFGTNGLIFGVTGAVAYGLHRGSVLIWPVLLIAFLGTMGLGLLGVTTPQTPSKTVRLIQPNAPQHQKWDREWMPIFFDRAIEQTAAGQAPDVVIWPETSVPSLLNFAAPWIEQMSLAARGAPVVAGIQRRENDDFYNSAILIETPDSIAAISDKAHLVPFGEYIPLARLLRPLGLGTLVDQVAGFSAGTGTGMMQIDGLGLARVLICYEGIFPEDMQRGDVRPDVILIITNDAWFGMNAGPRQHLVQAQARAIEQGLPVIRAANTGISAVIDPWGKITAQLPLNEAGYLDALVPLPAAPTLYARIGDWPLFVLLALCILFGVARKRPIVIDPKGTQG